MLEYLEFCLGSENPKVADLNASLKKQGASEEQRRTVVLQKVTQLKKKELVDVMKLLLDKKQVMQEMAKTHHIPWPVSWESWLLGGRAADWKGTGEGTQFAKGFCIPLVVSN